MNASPWSKYFCASGLDVATDRVCSPRPVYRITLGLDGLSVFAGSASTELGPTATAAESAINIWMFLDRMMRAEPPSINRTLTSGIGVLPSVVRVAWVIQHAPQLPGAYRMFDSLGQLANRNRSAKKNERSF